jgi:hypothetical protein
MTTKASTRSTKNVLSVAGASAFVAGAAFVMAYSAMPQLLSVSYSHSAATSTVQIEQKGPPPPPPLDTKAYDLKLLALAHVATSSPWYMSFLAGTTTVTLPGATTSVQVKPGLWPVRAPYPRDSRALLPFNRIVAYYGNFYSKGMGVLGQYPPDEMLDRLEEAVAEWKAADPSTPVIPAIHYIVEVAQGGAGRDGKYVGRMPDDQIDKALELAGRVNGLVFLDFQVGLSNLPAELPLYKEYLKLPNVHLGIDPEFAMHGGTPPGRVIGSLDAADVNYAAGFLAGLVKQYDLPPKILVVHRFTEEMVTNYKKIAPLPEVQIVMDMDGWGGQAKKKGTYNQVIAPEPVQFTGFKLFYKNDTLEGATMLSPTQVLELKPAPIYIQYQ